MQCHQHCATTNERFVVMVFANNEVGWEGGKQNWKQLSFPPRPSQKRL
jgi:hypothetical protein